jgi:hypothetical protein
VIFEKCAKLHSPRRLVQFWHIFQISLVVLIINCTPSRVITYTYCDATRDNSKFKLFHQQQNFAYSKTSFAFAKVSPEATDMLNLFENYDYSHHPFSNHIAHLTISQ